MSLGTANRTQVRYIAESVFGTIPGAGNPNNLRMTGESLAYQIRKETSKEIRTDRMVTGLIPVGANANGGINFELSYKEYDDLLEASLQGTWSEYGTAGVGAAVALDLNSTAGTITAGGGAPPGNDAFTGLAVGQFFRLKAPSDAADGAVLKLASRTSTVLTVDAATPLPGTGTRAGVAGCQVSSSRLGNGTTERFFTVERAHNDINQFFAFRGMSAAKLAMAFATGAITTGSFDFMGKDVVRDGATLLPGTPVASQTYDVMNAVDGVGVVLENGVELAGTFVQSLKFNLDNKLRGREAVGQLGAVSLASGTLEVKGEIVVYLADGTLYDKFLNNTATSLQWTSLDGSTNGYAFQFPRVKYDDAKVQAGGLDQDCVLSIPFTAILDSTTGLAMIVDRFGV